MLLTFGGLGLELGMMTIRGGLKSIRAGQM
jgi:hypothetical protein